MQKLPMRVPLYKDTGYQLSHVKPACLIPTAKVAFYHQAEGKYSWIKGHKSLKHTENLTFHIGSFISSQIIGGKNTTFSSNTREKKRFIFVYK